MNRIDGTMALVTGGPRGLGAAIARAFAGARVTGRALSFYRLKSAASSTWADQRNWSMGCTQSNR